MWVNNIPVYWALVEDLGKSVLCGSSMRGANNTGSSGSAYGGSGGTNPSYDYGGAGNPGGRRSL